MGIVPKFTLDDFSKELKKKTDAIERAVYERLNYLGFTCVKNAIDNRGYTDQTAHLRSSTGYIVVMKGKIMKVGGFEGEAEGGKTIGRTFAESLAGKNKDAYALYVVAGMNYASYVEATGRNVLTSAELLAEKMMPIMIQQLKNNIAKI